jgi:hypothetical protein
VRELNFDLVENPNNEICVKTLGQAIEIINYALLLTVAGLRDYDVHDLIDYLIDTRWYDNFKEETKLVYCDYLGKPRFLYRQTVMPGTKLIKFEELMINE